MNRVVTFWEVKVPEAALLEILAEELFGLVVLIRSSVFETN